MDYQIRQFEDSDYDMLRSWWIDYKEFPPTREMLPKETTFIIENNKTPLVAITLYLTNSMQFCMLDNFVGNPQFKGAIRKEASKLIIAHAEKVAKQAGYKSILCLAINEKLKEYYPTFGYKKYCDNISSFNKELI